MSASDTVLDEAPASDAAADAAPQQQVAPVEIDAWSTLRRSRFHDVEAVYAAGLYDRHQVPAASVQELLQYCQRYDLALSAEQQDASLLARAADDYVVLITAEAFLQLCRRTRMWLPGETWIENPKSGQDTIARSYCWLAPRAGETPSIKVGVAVKLKDYYVRSRGSSQPNWNWTVSPELQLMMVARVLAAREALGDLVSQHRTREGLLEIAYDPQTEAMRRQNQTTRSMAGADADAP